jgi:general secretion pathway protein D
MLRASALMATLAIALGCSLHRANQAFDEGRYEEALESYRSVLQRDPTNVKARIGLKRAAQLSAEMHLTKARDLERKGADDQSIKTEVAKALTFDLDNQIAQDWIVRLEQKIAREKAEQEAAEDQEAARARAEAQNPVQLDPRSTEGADLRFTRRTSLREIFASISSASGVNIILHSTFQDQNVSIDLRGLNFYRAMDTLMLQNDLFYRTIDKHTIMIFKNTPQNRDQYENQLVKTFYLANADPNEVRSTLTSIMPQLRLFTDKRMNAIIVRAKPLDMSIADRVIGQLDKALPEVMVYMELMEVTESTLQKVGLLPVLGAGDESGTFRAGATTVNNSSGLNTNNGFTRIRTADIRVLFPNLALDFLKSNGDARLVASPNVRVVTGQKGEVNIGEKISTTQSAISVPTTGAGTTGSTGGLPGGVGQTSFGYEDVGVKIAVEPRVHGDREVTLKIEAKVTTLKAGSQPGRPDLGQREIKTSARLRDGETAIFGGLLKDEEQKQLQGIWGLADIPLFGKLFSNNRTSKAKTDVILTIRAVLVRRPVLMEDDYKAFNPDDAASNLLNQKNELVKKAMNARKPSPAAGVSDANASTSANAATLAAPAQTPAATPNPQAPAPPISDPPVKSPIPGQDVRPPGSADLVFYISPTTAQMAKGEKVQMSILVSGGKGLSTGVLDLRIPPGLKLLSATAGDFLSSDGGSLDQASPANGALKLNFKRSGQGVDSGALVFLEFEAVAPGNSPVLIQSGQFLAGTGPVSARWVNALVTVQ